MKLKYIITIAITSLIVTSCDQNEVFTKEQYKNVFALVSQDENVYTKVFNLEKDESIGYISFSMGGTNKTTEDLTILIAEDPNYIQTYNRTNYDQEVARYAKPLPKNKYDIESLTCILPAGDIGAQIPIRIRPEGLSPDTTYFISVRVDSYNRYEVNPDKDYLLYRVRFKNKWAISDGSTNYTLRGKRKEAGYSEIEMPGMKIMHPLSRNKVRIMVGAETFKQEIETLEKMSVILEIDANNKVKISPFRDLNITQIDGDPDFPNIFFIENDGFKTYKTFLLHYSYTLNGKSYEMKEELRLQFKEEDEED